MIFSGGFGFAGAGKIKPASGETINLVWNGTGTGWTATNRSDQTIDVKWLNQNDKTSTEAGGDVNITGPDGTDDIIALCTMNGSITLTLNAPLEISTLFVFGSNVCKINLNGKSLKIKETLFLGSSWSKDGDIDNGLIANEDGHGSEGSKLGNLKISGSGSISIINFNTTTWGYSNDNPDVFKNESGTVNSLLTIDEDVTSFEVSTWETGSTTTGDGTTGATIPKITIRENSTTSIKISEITGHESLKDELVKDLIDTGAEVTVPYLWTGNGSDNSWYTRENWTNDTVPSGNVIAYIRKTDKQPEILERVDFSGGKIEIFDGAKLTIAEGGSLSIDANNITFGTDSSIVVNGILNSTKGFTVNPNFAGSTGTFSCSDSSNPLIIDTDLELSGNLISSNGTITINSGKNVTCNSISAATLENSGTVNANNINCGKTTIAGNVIANNITLAEILVVENSELKINEAATSGKITLKGNISSTGSKNLTLNGNVEIPSIPQLEINLNEGILKTKAIKSESSLSIKAKTQTFDGTISVTNDFTSEGETFTFAGKVTVNQNAQIQNTGLLKISDFVYGKKFVQEGSESGQVMISGSFEQSGESGESEKPTATFGSNVYFYNSSQNLSPITIGSDKSSITINRNLVIAKSKENDVAIKGTVKSNNFALYSGNVDLSGNLSTVNDVVVLGENYSLKDDQTGIENLYSYTENRPAHWSQASYTFETSLPDGTEISQNYAGTVKVAQDKSITVGKNLYANRTVFALSGALGSGKWKLNVPDTSDAEKTFCEVYNSEVSDCVAAYQIAALQCTDKSGNINWAFDDETGTVKITKAYSVSDNVIRVEFNKPVRILKDRFTQKQMRFSNEPDENHYFENVYLDEKCTTEASEVVNQYYEENGNKNYYVYVKANSKWNTDATGTFVGEEKSTDYDGVHQNTTICLDFPRAIVATTQSDENFFSYIITDLWGKRLTNYSARTTSGTQKNPFENVEDKTGPVLISVKTGQENHTEYDGTKGAQSQPSYDSHNFIEFVYSEFVNFGSKNSNGADEVFLEADDEEIEKAKNIQVTQKFGALQNEDITQSGELKFAGLAKIQNGKIYTGSQNNQGNADKYVNALYRFDKYSLRYSIAGYTHPTEFVQDAQGNNHKKWIGYIQEAELPSGTVSMICDGKNDLVFDMAGNSQTLVKNNLSVDSSKSGVYGNWDISKPIFAPLRMNETVSWKNNEFVEAIGNSVSLGNTLTSVGIHLFDNTPNFNSSDEAVWFTQRGWWKNGGTSLIFEDAYCADIFGGARAFETNKENRTSGGIRFSSLENGINAFLYTTDLDSNPIIHFDTSANVLMGANSKIFTGNSNVYREPNRIEGLYITLPLKDKNIDIKTTFKILYDDSIGFITDLAGNRLREATFYSVDMTPPSIEAVLSPIDNKIFYIFFHKKIKQNNLNLIKNDGEKIIVSESFLTLLPQCLQLIKIDEDGTFSEADIQVDKKEVAVPIDIIDNASSVFKMCFTREVSLNDIKNVYLRIVNPENYNFPMRDPVTHIENSNVTLIQDDFGNYIEMYQTHAISDIAINGINPLYGYNDSLKLNKAQNNLNDIGYIIRDWNENQKNNGTLYHGEEITIVCDVDNNSKIENDFIGNVRLFYNNDTNNKMIAEQFNYKIGGMVRLWFPNIMNYNFSFFSLLKNEKYNSIISERINNKNISAGLKFDFPKSVVENWKSGNQISFLFSYLNEDNSQLNIYPAPKFNLSTGLYELNNSMKFPLFAIRMKDVNDITSLDLWSFKVKSVTNQRGGVTILNNVINATYGEKAIVKINLPQDGNLDVMVMTLDGNIVTYLNHGATTSGEHYFTWNGTNNAGFKVARGLYFVRVISSTIDETRKIMVVKD